MINSIGYKLNSIDEFMKIQKILFVMGYEWKYSNEGNYHPYLGNDGYAYIWIHINSGKKAMQLVRGAYRINHSCEYVDKKTFIKMANENMRCIMDGTEYKF